RPPCSPLVPYTTLFRSGCDRAGGRGCRLCQGGYAAARQGGARSARGLSDTVRDVPGKKRLRPVSCGYLLLSAWLAEVRFAVIGFFPAARESRSEERRGGTDSG